MDITLSKGSTGGHANWLPVSDGEFHLFMRIYIPDMTPHWILAAAVIRVQE